MKYEIDIEGLPEGYKVNSITVNAKENVSQCFSTVQATIRLKKIHPRRIVLEETGEERKICYGEWYETSEHKLMRWPYGGKTDGRHKVWREVKENDLSLTNAEHKLSLSVDQCRKLFCNLDKDVTKLLREFIKDK